MEFAAGYLLVAGITAALLVLWAAEYRAHRRRLERIRVRVHVNGTRGKSSVTRLIAAGLRAGGYRVVAKTTGSVPSLIYPDGTERPIPRRGPPNIREQVDVVREASRLGADAIVLECMAVDPALQAICEERLVQATLAVITNVRADHVEQMGSTPTEIAKALSLTIPKGGALVTTADLALEVLEEEAMKRNAEIRVVRPTPADEGLTASFQHVEFAENVAAALAACEEVGVSREVAARGMLTVAPDMGALRRFAVSLQGKPVQFLSAFAANDPESSALALERAGMNGKAKGPVVFVLCCRADRADRSAQWGKALCDGFHYDKAILAGALTEAVVLRMSDPRRRRAVVNLGACQVDEVVAEVARNLDPDTTVVGLGNIVGLGTKLAEYFASLDGKPR